MTRIWFFQTGKAADRQNGGKMLGKRALPASVGVDGKPVGKASNTVIAESLQQISHEGAVLADLTDEKATEKVRIYFAWRGKSNICCTRAEERGGICPNLLLIRLFVHIGLLTSGLCFSLSWFMYMNDWFRILHFFCFCPYIKGCRCYESRFLIEFCYGSGHYGVYLVMRRGMDYFLHEIL